MKQSLISLRIKQLLAEKQMTETEVARIMKSDLASVSRWVNGHSNMTIRTVEKFETILGTIINVTQ